MQTERCMTIMGLMALGACSGTAGGSSEPTMTLHSVQELKADPKLFAQVDQQCEHWKGSQQSPLSLPAVVINTCNNLQTVKDSERGEKDRQELLRAADITNDASADATRGARR